MEATPKSNDFGNFRTPKKEDNNCEMEQGDVRQSRGLGSRRTRSQVAPEWDVKDALILVNEHAAVEGECQKALSSYQKWEIIVGNCTALGVARTLNQCRRKWDSLLVEYKKIKQWESQSSSDSYWTLERGRIKEFGLPENFDNELFNAIDNFLQAKENQSDTDPDIDPEEEAEMLDVIAEIGSKKQRRQVLPRKRRMEGKEKNNVERRIEENQKRCIEEKEKNNAECRIEDKQKCHIEKEKNNVERRIEEKEKNNVEEEETSYEEKEQMMVGKLRANAELIYHILAEKANCGPSDSKKGENFLTDFRRRQGDKLIACFGDIANTLEQLCDIVQECR